MKALSSGADALPREVPQDLISCYGGKLPSLSSYLTMRLAVTRPLHEKQSPKRKPAVAAMNGFASSSARRDPEAAALEIRESLRRRIREGAPSAAKALIELATMFTKEIESLYGGKQKEVKRIIVEQASTRDVIPLLIPKAGKKRDSVLKLFDELTSKSILNVIVGKKKRGRPLGLTAPANLWLIVLVDYLIFLKTVRTRASSSAHNEIQGESGISEDFLRKICSLPEISARAGVIDSWVDVILQVLVVNDVKIDELFRDVANYRDDLPSRRAEIKNLLKGNLRRISARITKVLNADR